MLNIDKRILNFLVIIFLSISTFAWTFWVFHQTFMPNVVITVIIVRLLSSVLLFKDYSLSWSKSSQKTFLIKSIVYIVAFIVYTPIFYGKIYIYFFMAELFVYLFAINFLMYGYHFYYNRSKIKKTKSVAIYGAGKAGVKLHEEFASTKYKVKYFIDDNPSLHIRTIDSLRIISKNNLKRKLQNKKLDLLIIAIPSAKNKRTNEIYEELHEYFHKIKILPSLDNILTGKAFTNQLKDISVVDLLARHPKDLDKDAISTFIKKKTVLITGAGGSIGSEIARQCVKFSAEKLILLDHSEYNLYQIEQEIGDNMEIHCVMQSVVNKKQLQKTFERHKPQIVIHAAAYKHVPMVEANISEAIVNNVIGTKNCIDVAIENHIEKFILISTDKAVRPTKTLNNYCTVKINSLYLERSYLNLNICKINKLS